MKWTRRLLTCAALLQAAVAPALAQKVTLPEMAAVLRLPEAGPLVRLSESGDVLRLSGMGGALRLPESGGVLLRPGSEGVLLVVTQAPEGDSGAVAAARSWRLPVHTLRSAGITALAGAVTFGGILLLPEDISKWRREAGPDGFRMGPQQFRQAFTRAPVWDQDEWYVNYIGHPVAGMHTYLLERNEGASVLRAFLFSTAASVSWEYLVESWAERPSIQDLLVTSTVGSLLGELNHQLTQRLRRDGLSGAEKVMVTILNPAYVVRHGYR